MRGKQCEIVPQTYQDLIEKNADWYISRSDKTRETSTINVTSVSLIWTNGFCFSPGERLELSEVGPATSLRLRSAPRRAVPPCWGLRRRRPSRVPEICCPARTWKQDRKNIQTKTKSAGVHATLLLLSSHLPVSDDVFCPESSSSSDSDPWSRSLPPFSMLPLELPSEVWETPNLERRDSGYKLRTRQKRLQRGNQKPENIGRFTLFWI